MALAITVDLGSPIPIYEQLRSQVATQVATGQIRPGDRLPAARWLAADLQIAAGTVSRAYRELEIDGIVTTRRRTGTIIRAEVHAPQPSSAMLRNVDNFIRAARKIDMSDEAIIETVRAGLSRID